MIKTNAETSTITFHPNQARRDDSYQATGRTQQEAADNLYRVLYREMWGAIGREATDYREQLRADVRRAISQTGWDLDWQPSKGLVISVG